ncbi:DUF4355 domain-containing protein [Thermogutta sp.]|uniref:DUF4355 domain-containing protein n=1 Tax=Thermogutta sp. TaxID=1962930 RepID=UPI00322025D9
MPEEVQEVQVDTQVQEASPAPEASQTLEPERDDRRFSVDEVNRIVAQRLERERKRLRSEIETELKKAAEEKDLSEIERLQRTVNEYETKLRDVEYKLNDRAIRSEAQAVALELGIKPDRIRQAIRLADFAEVTVDPETREPDREAIKQALKQVVVELPELMTSTSARAGVDFSTGAGQQPLNDDIIAKMSTEELKRRMPEIQAYYASKRR